MMKCPLILTITVRPRAGRLDRVAADVGKVDLWHQYGFDGTIRQLYGLAFQPDDVAGQPANLVGAEGDAGTQPELRRNAGGVVQHLFVEVVVAWSGAWCAAGQLG